jgi:hypothetical protein
MSLIYFSWYLGHFLSSSVSAWQTTLHSHHYREFKIKRSTPCQELFFHYLFTKSNHKPMNTILAILIVEHCPIFLGLISISSWYHFVLQPDNETLFSLFTFSPALLASNLCFFSTWYLYFCSTKLCLHRPNQTYLLAYSQSWRAIAIRHIQVSGHPE